MIILNTNDIVVNISHYFVVTFSEEKYAFSEEKYAEFIGELTACVDRSFTVRINNGSDGCHREASDLIIDLINHVFMDPSLHPCPGINSNSNPGINLPQQLYSALYIFVTVSNYDQIIIGCMPIILHIAY